MVEKSAGAVIFRRDNNKIYYLLLHYPSPPGTTKEYWDLPKGHIEKGEKLEDTAKREVEEETGLKEIEFLKGFKKTIKYFFKWEDKNILKFVTFYLAETKTKNIEVSFEHLGFEWLLYEEALVRLTFKNAKDVLRGANNYLTEYVTAS